VKKLQGDTIHVSNLASDVTDEDVREIFERIGTVRSCIVNYTSAGVSTGTATVTFARKSDAEKAVQDYDEAEVDGRMMKLKLIGTIVTAPVVVKKQKPVIQQQQPIAPMYVQQPVSFAPAYSMDYAYEPRGPRAPKAVVSRGGGSAKPARGGAVAKPAPKPVKKEVSQADLDAELDGYHQSKAAPAPAAAGQPTSA
jgi:RNA recognition motif-containing protein